MFTIIDPHFEKLDGWRCICVWVLMIVCLLLTLNALFTFVHAILFHAYHFALQISFYYAAFAFGKIRNLFFSFFFSFFSLACSLLICMFSVAKRFFIRKITLAYTSDSIRLLCRSVSCVCILIQFMTETKEKNKKKIYHTTFE